MTHYYEGPGGTLVPATAEQLKELGKQKPAVDGVPARPIPPQAEPTERCSGHCCRQFTLPFSPDELLDQMTDPKKNFLDGVQIAEMVVYLGFTTPPPEMGPTEEQLKVERHRYTCRNFDDATGSCTVYETRPHMCRDYPHGNPCRYVGCTMKLPTLELEKGENNAPCETQPGLHDS